MIQMLAQQSPPRPPRLGGYRVAPLRDDVEQRSRGARAGVRQNALNVVERHTSTVESRRADGAAAVRPPVRFAEAGSGADLAKHFVAVLDLRPVPIVLGSEDERVIVRLKRSAQRLGSEASYRPRAGATVLGAERGTVVGRGVAFDRLAVEAEDAGVVPPVTVEVVAVQGEHGSGAVEGSDLELEREVLELVPAVRSFSPEIAACLPDCGQHRDGSILAPGGAAAGETKLGSRRVVKLAEDDDVSEQPAGSRCDVDGSPVQAVVLGLVDQGLEVGRPDIADSAALEYGEQVLMGRALTRSDGERGGTGALEPADHAAVEVADEHSGAGGAGVVLGHSECVVERHVGPAPEGASPAIAAEVLPALRTGSGDADSEAAGSAPSGIPPVGLRLGGGQAADECRCQSGSWHRW